ncbi:gamma-glutamylcyclotransferase family protein [Halomonas sp. HP20-15]|uniref:gamma-glutamylcyclotransferase family protein n=1 Tax=Halomonas sp. HP20-15 TaxID=3085901 RepID=UPI0029814557|nr:gamma-glutamylcyclotransferase family protein [Halomonas sp. HP20-15]MDW5375503.1 gamma-glutamylcyclotransferase family protein [Halomonas sp. HP20-15]
MKLIKRLALALVLMTVLAVGYLWVVFASPYGYTPPENLPAITREEPHRVFVYGTLRFGAVRWLVYGRWGDPRPSVLPGYDREGLDIEKQSGAEVAGYVLSVSSEELANLDRYERLGVRYNRHRLTLANGKGAWVYARIQS